MEIIAPPADIAEDTPIVRFCHDQGLNVLETGPYGTWPHTDNSIIQFDNGIFCYTSSFADRTVVDFETGEVVTAQMYGTPNAWAVFEELPVAPTPHKKDDSRSYTALKHETTFSVARKLKDYGFTEAEFAEHNGIKLGALVEGQTYHLPKPAPKQAPTESIKVYDSPQLMHISRPGGAQKWAFGNVRSVDDIISGSGMYPENKELQIVAEVTVPVAEETFRYYMDGLALGSYPQSGKVAYMIGFAYRDLTAGPAPDQARDIPPTITRKIETTVAAIEQATKAPEPAQPPRTVFDTPRYEDTYTAFSGGPQKYVVGVDDDYLTIYDLSGQRPPARLRDNGHYVMAGTFWDEDENGNLTQYARPLQSVKAFPENWYGIPMQYLTSAAKLYDEEADLVTRLNMKSSDLTPTEKYIIPGFAATRLSYDRLKLYGTKLKNKTKEITK